MKGLLLALTLSLTSTAFAKTLNCDDARNDELSYVFEIKDGQAVSAKSITDYDGESVIIDLKPHHWNSEVLTGSKSLSKTHTQYITETLIDIEYRYSQKRNLKVITANRLTVNGDGAHKGSIEDSITLFCD